MIRIPRGEGTSYSLRRGRAGRRQRPVSLADATSFRPPQVLRSEDNSSDSFVDRTDRRRLQREEEKREDGDATVTSLDSLNLLKTQGGSTISDESRTRVTPARQMLAGHCGHWRSYWRSFSAASQKAGIEVPGCQEAPPASMQRVFAMPLQNAPDPSGRPRFIDDTTVRFYEGRSAMVPVVFALAKQVFRGDYSPDPLLQSMQAARVVEGRDSAFVSRWSNSVFEEQQEQSVVSDGRVEKLLMSYNKARAHSSRSEEWDGRLPSISNSNAPCDKSVDSDPADARPLMAAIPPRRIEGDWLLPSGTAESESDNMDIRNLEPGGGRVTNFAASHLSLDTTWRSSSVSQPVYSPEAFQGREPSMNNRPCPRRVLRKSRISLLGKPIRSVFPTRRIRFNADQTM